MSDNDHVTLRKEKMTSEQKNAAQIAPVKEPSKVPLNKTMDAALRRMPRINHDFERTLKNAYAAILGNVKIEWPSDSVLLPFIQTPPDKSDDPKKTLPSAFQDNLLYNIFVQLCTHGIVGEILVVRPNDDPTMKRAHQPLLESTHRYNGSFYSEDGFSIYWKPDTDNDALNNVDVFVHQYPVENDLPEETTRWLFNGWLTTYINTELQLSAMNTAAYNSFIRSSEGFFRRFMSVSDAIKDMPESRLARDVHTFLSETKDLNGNVVLPREYNAQVSFAKTASRQNPPNTAGWENCTNVTPPGMTEEVTLPSAITSGLLSEIRTETYVNMTETLMNMAMHIRRAVQAAVTYFYAKFLQKDRYAYYVMLEARRQIESICLYFKQEIAFTDVSYWLVLPNVPLHNEEALKNALHGIDVTGTTRFTDDMNAVLKTQITNYSIGANGLVEAPPKKRRRLTVDKQLVPYAESQQEDIRRSPILIRALAEFIVKEPAQMTVDAPLFSWPPLKNILYKEEKNERSVNRKKPVSRASEKKRAK